MRRHIACWLVLLAGCGAVPRSSRTLDAPVCGSPRPDPAPVETGDLAARAAALGRMVHTVDLVGVPHGLRDELVGGLAVRAGQPLTAESLRADLGSLARLGIAESISVAAEPMGESIAIQYQLVPFVPIGRVTMTGDRHPALGELAALSGALSDTSRVDRLRHHAREMLAKEGYLDAKVGATRTRSDGRDDLCISVALGRQYLIDRIEATGGDAVNQEAVERAVARRDRRLNAVGGVYVAHRLREDLKELTLAYLDRGYVDVRIGDPVVTIDRRRARISIRIPIDQGEPYRLGVVAIPWPIGASLGLASGGRVSQLAIDRARERLDRWAGPRGIVVMMDVAVHASERTVDVRFTEAAVPDAP